MPDVDQTTVSSERKKANEGVEGVLMWLVRSGPLWARIPAVFITFVAALSSPFLVWENYSSPKPKTEKAGPPNIKMDPTTVVAQKDETAQLAMATFAKATGDEKEVEDVIDNPQSTPEQRKKAKELFRQIKHELRHLEDPKDSSIPWMVFSKTSSREYFGYKLFPSDKCLLVTRIEYNEASYHGTSDYQPGSDYRASSDWIADPNRPYGDTAAEGAEHPADFLFGRRSATEADPELRLISASFGSILNRTPVQGSCLNPHPWPFVGAWGPPINQCQQPFYRRWNDGCAHVQVFDHCANVWGPVVWQFCASQHHP